MDEGTYRVLPRTDDGRVRLLDRETYEPVVLAATGHDAPVEDLRAGYLVAAELDWAGDPEGRTDPHPAGDGREDGDGDGSAPTVRSLTVERPTLYAFADAVDPMFEVAQNTWEAARASGDAMNASRTHDTDGAVNGVVYVFAESGDRGRFEEFRDGSRPLEPLVDRVNEGEGGQPDGEAGQPDGDDSPGTSPREVFVLRDLDGAFTAVTITLRKGGRFADTVRDTYDIERPEEPLV